MSSDLSMILRWHSHRTGWCAAVRADSGLEVGGWGGVGVWEEGHSGCNT